MSCKIIKISASDDAEALSFIRRVESRGNPVSSGGNDVETDVRKIISDVRERGDDALVENTRRFDAPGFEPPFLVSQETMAHAANSISGEDRNIIIEASSHIRTFHEAQKDQSWFITRSDGTILGQKIEPVERAGLYVPGGKGGDTPLISSLLMAAIPAQVAGVKEIVLVTPPKSDGSLNAHILAAAYLLDIPKVYRVGGPWAIAAMAYGTKEIPRVDVIAGPGNIYVTTAKKLVQGKVGIDMIAGPSEILILADDSANPEWLAADLLSQAEHDRLASAILITTSGSIAEMTALALERRASALPRSAIIQESLDNWGAIFVVPDLASGISLANTIAPEHMEVCTYSPWDILPRIHNAGAVFLGSNSPEPVGDYYAGPNHVLPTLGTAKHSSALSVQTFCKRSSIIAATAQFSQRFAASIARLARIEGLEAHAQSIESRI